jgi:cytochrome oxidase Cu insertion factor (SCO1/SenC/PrrC family)
MLPASNLQRALVLVLVSLLVAIGVVLLVDKPSDSAPAAPNTTSKFDGPTLPPDLRAANFSLTDQNGHRVTLSQYRGRVVVLTFIHSLCHDTCPFMVEQIKGALNDLPQSGREVPAIGVSVAPSEDTVASRKRFLAKHQMTGRIAFVNGPLREMRKVWHAYSIEPVTPKIDHSTFVLLIDKRGIERVGFAADQLTPEDLVHDIGVLEREPA